MTGGAASLRLFRSRNFRALWIGQLISIFGDRLTYLALLALVMERAADPKNPAPELALIPIVSFLPAILIGPWAGALVDGWNTRTTLLVSDAIRGVLVLAIVPAAAWGGLPAALGIIFLLYVVNSFFLPARSAILPDLVPEGSLVEANSLATLAGVLATIAGSLAGGMLVERMGWRIGFQSDAATYFLSVAALAFIQFQPRTRQRPAEPRAGYRQIVLDVREGAGMTLRSAPALGSIAVMTLLWVAGGALHVSMPQVVAGRGVGVVSGVGGAVAAAAIGMVAGTLLLASLGPRISVRARIVLGLVGGGAAMAGFAALHHPVGLWCAAFAAGGFVAFLLVTTEAVLQTSIAAEARGRVFALRDFLARAGLLLSAGLLGVFSRRMALAPEWIVGAAGGLLVVGGCFSALWPWDKPRELRETG